MPLTIRAPKRKRKPSPLPTSPTRQTLDTSISEHEFQQRLIKAARLLGWIVYSIPDSRLATAAGFPDLVLIRQKNGHTRLIFAELKRQRGGIVSPDQKLWLSLLAECPVESYLWKPAMWDSIMEILK